MLLPASQRFAPAAVTETPSFQRHVAPLFGRLGCSGRAATGPSKAKAGFGCPFSGTISQADYDGLRDKEHPRIDLERPAESLIVAKPTDADGHGGGVRYEKGSWQHHVLLRWIEAGAPFSPGDIRKIVALEVRPPEILFQRAGRDPTAGGGRLG